MTGLSEMCRSAAREGAKAPDGDVPELPLDARAVGEIIENKDPTSKVIGYTRSTTGAGGFLASEVIVDSWDRSEQRTMRLVSWMWRNEVIERSSVSI